MKSGSILVAFLVTGIFVPTGCGKKQAPTAPYNVGGVMVDIPKLKASFETADAALRNDVGEVATTLRYNQYDKALEQLQKVAANPNLNEAQKKEVNDVMEQLKQLISKNPPTK